MHASQIVYERLAPLVNSRCYPLFIPETTANMAPYIVYQIISTSPDNSLDGATGHEWVRMQIDVYCADYDALILLTADVIERLDQIKPSSYHGAQYIFDNQSALYRAMIEYGFWHTLSL